MRFLGQIGSIVDWILESRPQRALGIARLEELADLRLEVAGVLVGEFGLGRVEGGEREVLGGVGVEGIDVDGAPGIGERGLGVLLDNRHCWAIFLWLYDLCGFGYGEIEIVTLSVGSGDVEK